MIIGVLTQDNIIVVDFFLDQLIYIWTKFLSICKSFNRGKSGNTGWVTPFLIPEVVDVSIG